MGTILLPYRPRQAWLKSFGLALSIAAALLAAVMALVGFPALSGLGALAACLLALAAMVRPETLRLPYRLWNKLARHYAAAARIWLLGTCFYFVFPVVGRAGSSLGLAPSPSATSHWVPRETLPAITYTSQHRTGAAEAPCGGWIRTFVSWAARSGNFWAIFLLPFLILLSALQPEEEEAFPSNIYTLF